MAQRELHQPRRHGADRLAEAAAENVAFDRRASEELRRVYQIESLGAHFQCFFSLEGIDWERVASRFSMPRPEKKRRRAWPMVTSAGMMNRVVSKTGWPPRGFRLRRITGEGVAWWSFGMLLAIGHIGFVYGKPRGKVDLRASGH